MKINIKIKINIQKSLNFKTFLKNLNLYINNIKKIIKSIKNTKFKIIFIPLPTL